MTATAFDPGNLSIEPTPSFAYPKIGKTRRVEGQGCTSCVHTFYCEAYSRLMDRQGDPFRLEPTWGISCESWSNRKQDYVPRTEEDLRHRLWFIRINDLEIVYAMPAFWYGTWKRINEELDQGYGQTTGR